MVDALESRGKIGIYTISLRILSNGIPAPTTVMDMTHRHGQSIKHSRLVKTCRLQMAAAEQEGAENW